MKGFRVNARTLAAAGLLAALACCAAAATTMWSPSGDLFDPDSAERRKPQTRAGRVEIAEVTATTGDYRELTVVRLGSDGKDLSLPLRSGDRILAGDRITVGPGGRLELFLGFNARVLVSADTTCAMLGQEVTTQDGMTATRRHLRLERGALRARVRHNIRQPEPLSIHFREAILELGNPGQNQLGGTDGIVLVSDNTDPARVVILNGESTLRTRIHASDGGHKQTLSTAQESMLPLEQGAAIIVQTLEKTKLMEIHRKMRFSIDRFPDEVELFDFHPDSYRGP